MMNSFPINLLRSCAISFAFAAVGATGGTDEQDRLSDLKSLSIEELMDLEISIASKRTQRLSQTSAAAHVITKQDIARSGATSIPELLRSVPGLHVARIDANKWNVSSRGFSGRFSNKLLVLIDGRSVYTPLFSGVYWEVQDTLLEDIERIEVIRGPGASLWGANAVNGVINIITKNAHDTQGGLAVVGGGSEEHGFGQTRYGGGWGAHGAWRVYGKYFNRDGSRFVGGGPRDDDWYSARGGFRLDWEKERQQLTLQGDLYSGRAGGLTSELLGDDKARFSGGNALLNWRRRLKDSSELRFRFYFDRTDRQEGGGGEVRDTFDFELQHLKDLGQRHDLTWGFGYRASKDSVENSLAFNLRNPSRTLHKISGFVQDDISIVRDRFRLTLGTKFEHNRYSATAGEDAFDDFDVQPNLRLLWTPGERHSIWGSVSRAVRLPSRAELGIQAIIDVIPAGTPTNPSPLPVFVTIVGDPGVRSEKLLAYEAGYRVKLRSDIRLDTTIFYNDYDDQLGIDSGVPMPSPLDPTRLILPMTTRNVVEGQTYGLEASVDWQATSRLRIHGSYSFLHLDLTNRLFGLADTGIPGASPRHQAYVKAATDLPRNLVLDLQGRFVGALPSLDVSNYIAVDARLGWRPRDGVEFSVVGQNLTDPSHVEFRSEVRTNPLSEIERGVYGQLRFDF